MAFEFSGDVLLGALYILLPSYTTNASPLLLGGGRPLDLGRNFLDRERIFGDHKTIRGFFVGLAVGTLVSMVEEIFLGRGLFIVGFLVTLGSLLGDLGGAFLKRRIRIKPGASLPVMDQLDFVLGAFLLVYPIYRVPLDSVLLLLLITPPIHLATNVCAYLLKLKDTYW